MQIQARQTLASLLLPLQTSVTVISRHNPKAQAKHDGQEFKLWECTRVYAKFYFWSLRQTGATVQRVVKIAMGEFQAKWEWVSTLGSSCPHPTPPYSPWPRLNSGQTSQHQWARLNCFSIAEECSTLHIHSQTVQGKNSCQIHNWTYLTLCQHLEDWIQQIWRWKLR